MSIANSIREAAAARKARFALGNLEWDIVRQFSDHTWPGIHLADLDDDALIWACFLVAAALDGGEVRG